MVGSIQLGWHKKSCTKFVTINIVYTDNIKDEGSLHTMTRPHL